VFTIFQFVEKNKIQSGQCNKTLFKQYLPKLTYHTEVRGRKGENKVNRTNNRKDWGEKKIWEKGQKYTLMYHPIFTVVPDGTIIVTYESTESREYGHRDPLRRPFGTLYPLKLASTSPTSGGRSVGIVHSRTKATELLLL
jgi:hypothetical protein